MKFLSFEILDSDSRESVLPSLASSELDKLSPHQVSTHPVFFLQLIAIFRIRECGQEKSDASCSNSKGPAELLEALVETERKFSV